MAGAPNRLDLEPFRMLFRVGSSAGMTDGELLERFTNGPEEVASSAFSALVERHGETVRRVCRQILGDPHDADDAAQATFLVLARRASSVRRRESVSSWLFGVAVRVSRRTRADSARRRALERQKGAMMADRHRQGDGVADSVIAGNEAVSALVEELERLPERLRAPIVACHLEGLTQEQAALRLRCPVRTLQRRLASGRGRLRDRLERRDLGLSAVPSLDGLALLRLLGSEPLRGSPAWAGETVRAALAVGARCTVVGVGASPAAVSLARATLWSMSLMSTASIAVPTLAAVSMIAALAFSPIGSPDDPPPPIAAISPIEASRPQEEPSTTALELTVVDSRTGLPLEGLTLGVGFGRARRNEPEVQVTTGADGVASILVPEGEAGNLMIDIH